MGSLSITPISCTHLSKPPTTQNFTMKAFTTLATILGASYATPTIPQQFGAIGHHLSQQQGVHELQNTQHMTTSPLMRTSVTTHHQMSPVMHSTYTKEHMANAMAPKQFFMQDDFGNYHYGYATQDSERSEESNGQTVKGHYTYIMADGQKRRVDYIADNQGFHILRDDADLTNRIKREAEAAVEPDLIRTRMTAVMDSTSLMDDNQDMHSTNNLMGRDMTSTNNMMLRNKLNNQMSSNMYRSSDLMNQGSNLMGSDMSTNMMGHNIGKNMIGQNMYSKMLSHDMSSNMMGRNVDNTLMGHGMSSNMMGRDMSFNAMDKSMMGRQNMYNMFNLGRDMSSSMVSHHLDSNMMGPDMSSNMMGHNMNQHTMGNTMIGQAAIPMSSNMMNDMPSNIISQRKDNTMIGHSMDQNLYNNMMGRDMVGQDMSSRMMGRDMNRMSPVNMMSQRMQIEQVPAESFNQFY